MTKSRSEFTKDLLIKIIGEDRKYKTFNRRMYVSLGNNKIALIESGYPTAEKNYGWNTINIRIFDKAYGRIDSISIDFEEACRGTEFENESRNYIVDCNGNRWYREEPPNEVFNIIHNEAESYLEIFEDNF